MQPVAVTPCLAPPDLRPAVEDVLASLGRVRFVSTASLLAYGGPLGLTADVVDVWVRAGLVHRASVAMEPLRPTETEYVALSAAGARELALGGRASDFVSPARLKRTSQKRAHDLAVGETALAVLALERHHRLELVGLQVDDAHFGTSTVLETARGPKRVALHADLLLAVREGGRARALLVEVDRGTISLARMAEKYAAYVAWWRGGGPERDFSVRGLQVLTVARDAKRAKHLHDVALAANDGKRSGFLLFAEQADFAAFDPTRLLKPVARPLGVDQREPLFHP